MTQGDKTFDQPVLTVNSPYDTVCGTVVYQVKYGDPLAALGGSEPLSYANEDFTINTSDDSLIDSSEPYQLIATLQDYTQATASKYDSQSTITYESPCPLAGDTNLSYTTFTATTGALETDSFSDSPKTIDVSTLFTVVASFCEDTIIYEVTKVTRPNGIGGLIEYTGSEYPKTLATLNASNVLTGQAGVPQYKTTDDADVNMPPGTYTFTITGKTPLKAGITQVTKTTTVTWTLTDPCSSQLLTMSAISPSAFTYTISDTA